MKEINEPNLIINKLMYEDYKQTERADDEIYEIADIDTQIDSKQGLITINSKLSSDLVDDSNSTNKFITQTQANQIEANKNYIIDLTNKVNTFGTIVTHDEGDYLPSNTVFGKSLGYVNSELSLKDQNGNTLSTVIIKSATDVDNITVNYNTSEELQAIGTLNRKNGTAKYDWIGSLSEYQEGVASGTIPENYLCFITDDTTGSLASVDWGNIEGNLSNQTDLITALNNKYDISNPNHYINLLNLNSTALGLTFNQSTGDIGLASGYVIPTITDIEKVNSALQPNDNITELINNAGFITLGDISTTVTGLTYNNTTGELSLTSGYTIPTTTEVSKANSALQPNDNISSLINDSGYITGIDSEDVTTALGYTPYNSTNPDNFIDLTDLSTSATGLTYDNTTGILSLTSGYQIPTTTEVSKANSALQPNDNISSLINDSGYITGINSEDVTNALGYTPYNATNPDNYITLLSLNSTALGLTYDNTTGTFSLTSGYQIPTTAQVTQIGTNTSDIGIINTTLNSYGNIVTHDTNEFLSSSTKYGSSLSYSNDTLTLEDQDGNTLDTVTIKSAPNVDETTIDYNSSEELQAIGTLDRNSGNAKYDWIGSLSEYQAGIAGGTIPSNYLCFITDDTAGSLASVDWGNIEGNLSDQTDLKNALDSKYSASNPNNYINLLNIDSTALGITFDQTTGDIGLTSGYAIPTTTEIGLANSALQPNDNISELNNNAGYITGIDSSDVTTALGYTPYNSTNPNNYINLLNINSTALGITFDQSTGDIGLISGYAIPTTTEIGLANSALQASDIENSTSSTSTTKALSANMGKSLQDQVDNLSARGRFLSLWDCATGLAETNPPSLPYTYKSGDYFIIGNIGSTNYKPTGSSYTGTASTSVETEAVDVEDVYYYDGSTWHLQLNTQKTVTFANIAGQPSDNTNLASALNDKYDTSNPNNYINLLNINSTALGITFDQSTGDIGLTSGYGIPTTTEIGLANSALQPNDNISNLTNDSGYITRSGISTTATGLTYDSSTGVLSLTSEYQIPTITQVSKLDNVIVENDLKTINSSSIVGSGNLDLAELELPTNDWTEAVQNTNLGSNSWRSIAYNGTKFVALGYSGYISTSTDGISWTTSSYKNALDSRSWTSIIYDGTKFVALGSSGYTSTSIDGTTWTSATYNSNLDSRSWTSIIYDGTKFVALGSSGYISTSIDGTTWTSATYNSNLGSHDWASLAYDGTKLVALGLNGYISTSTDGTTWTTATQNANLGSRSWASLAYDGTKFVALGGSGYISTSTDGTTWTTATQSTNLGSNYWWSMCYSGTKFVALGHYGYISLLKESTSISNITGNSLGIKFTDLSKEYTLLDGTTGKILSERIPDLKNINGNNLIGAGGLNLAELEFPELWTLATQNTDLGNHIWNSICYGNNKFVAIATGGYTSTSIDGTTWTTAIQVTNLGNNGWSSLAYGNNKFVALSRGYISTSTDGTTWTPATQNTNLGYRYWYALTYGNNKFVALSQNGYISTSTDGTTWVSSFLNSNLGNHNWYSLTYGNNKFVAIGTGGYISTSIDGLNWSLATQNTDLGNHSWRSICYDGITFVALDSVGYVSTSTDGIAWVTRYNGNLDGHDWHSLASDGTKFVALGSSGYVSTSTGATTISNIKKNLLSINFETLNREYTLLDGTTGKIPSERLNESYINSVIDSSESYIPKSDLVNQILELPQHIKYEVNSSGQFVLKAGSKVFIPNGVNSSTSALECTELSISSDLTTSFDTSLGIVNYYIYVSSSGNLLWRRLGWTSSGTSDPATADTTYYDTGINIIKHYDSGAASTTVSYPVALVQTNLGVITNVTSIFNSTGSIGYSIWIGKGVKFLAPYYRNEDGTLKYLTVTTSDYQVWTYPYNVSLNKDCIFLTTTGALFRLNNELVLFMNSVSGLPTPEVNRYYIAYIRSENIWKQSINGSAWEDIYVCMLGHSVVGANNLVVSYNPFNPARVLTENDIGEITNLSFPNTDPGAHLSLSAVSGGNYTATMNGWFCLNYQTSAGGYAYAVSFPIDTANPFTSSYYGVTQLPALAYNSTLSVPVSKGQVLYLAYANITVNSFKFVPALGQY